MDRHVQIKQTVDGLEPMPIGELYFEPYTRAASLLISILGWRGFTKLPMEVMEDLLVYVGTELEIVKRFGFTTMSLAKDCREAPTDVLAAEFPGMVRWDALKQAQEVK